MSVSLKPSSSLGFNRPLTQLVKRVLTVTNNNDQPVAFKVKTTAPKLYCVRPNSGRIEPGDSVEVQVLLQAMKEEPPANSKCKDKFLVQSTIITPEKEAMPLHDLWANVDGEESRIHQQKVKVVYLPPVGQELPEEDENQSSFLDNTARYASIRHDPELQGNGHPELSLPHEPQGPLERAFSPAVGDYAVPEDDEHIPEPEPAPAPAPAAQPPLVPMEARNSQSTVIPVITPSAPADDEVRAQLAAAQAEISRLRALLESVPEPGAEDSSLRRRRLQSDKSDTMTVVSEGAETDFSTMVGSGSIQQEGISPQVVGVIAFVVFALTYVFF